MSIPCLRTKCVFPMLVTAICFVAGCSQPTQSKIKFMETRELDLPYEEAYSAALNDMFGMGLSLQHTDKQSGVISGQSGDHVQRATIHPFFRGLYAVRKVTLMLTGKF